jgi:phage major head subunit gpT-like protein
MAANLNLPVQGNAQILNTVVDLRYREGFENAKPWIGALADEQDYTRGKTVIIPWTDPAPRFAKFTGEFIEHPWIVDAIQTSSDPWQSNIAVDMDERIENVYMDISSQARSLGTQAKMLPCDMAALALRTQGSSSSTPFVWYDGQPAFSEVHPIDPKGLLPGTWANLFKGLPFTYENVRLVYETLCQGVVLPNGRQINVRPNKLGVPGKYILQAKEICHNDLIVRSVTTGTNTLGGSFAAINNILKGMMEPVVMNELTQTIEGIPGEPDVWYMWDDSVVKPMTMYWIRRAYVTPFTNDADYALRKANKYVYGGRGHAVGLIKAPWYIARIEPGIGP